MTNRQSSSARQTSLALLVAIAAAWPGVACAYTFVSVDRPGAAASDLWDINNSGVAVGNSDIGAYLFSAGVFTPLSGPAGALSVAALGISDGGVVVGSYYTTTTTDPSGTVVPGPTSGFILAGGSYTALTVAGASFVQPRAVSPDGRYVTGYYFDTVNHAFVYDRTTAAMTVIASGTQLVLAQGVNLGAQVVGNRYLAGTPAQRVGFIYDIGSATLTDYALPGAIATSFRAIDDSGRIAGFFTDAAGTHGFVGSPAAYQVIDYPGSTRTIVEGINNQGALVGDYLDANDIQHGFIATVPEPAAWLTLCSGLALLAGFRRRA